jgi:hypothetical protein
MEYDLDSYASLYIDAVGYRENAAKANMALGKAELDACNGMRKDLLLYIYKALGVTPETHNVSLRGKKAIVTEVKKEEALKAPIPT